MSHLSGSFHLFLCMQEVHSGWQIPATYRYLQIISGSYNYYWYGTTVVPNLKCQLAPAGRPRVEPVSKSLKPHVQKSAHKKHSGDDNSNIFPQSLPLIVIERERSLERESSTRDYCSTLAR